MKRRLQSTAIERNRLQSKPKVKPKPKPRAGRPRPQRKPSGWPAALATAKARLVAAGTEGSEAESQLRWLAAHLLRCGLLDVELRWDEAAGAGLPGTISFGESWSASVARLERGEPVQYVIGETDFMGMRFFCDAWALIPRPETELVVEAAEAFAREALAAPYGTWPRPLPVLDVCTGSGCIACSLAARLGDAAAVAASDISADALALARKNATALGVGVALRKADLFEGVAPASVALVTANPPYVSSADCDRLPHNVRDWEPRLALDGGEGGMEIISRLVAGAADVLLSGGRLVMEIGEDQGPAVRELLCQERTTMRMLELRRDFAGRDRVVVAERLPR
ncbi:MAG: peptide chain release factor N(5)-glutamine methyltransferase [Kiritimatiellae bacterium]|nr:peptide chain release factor N(5)-glutamine methyltransferase [Kiritimatiellia bacterium]